MDLMLSRLRAMTLQLLAELKVEEASPLYDQLKQMHIDDFAVMMERIMKANKLSVTTFIKESR
jgi:hypothetical protein